MQELAPRQPGAGHVQVLRECALNPHHNLIHCDTMDVSERLLVVEGRMG